MWYLKSQSAKTTLHCDVECGCCIEIYSFSRRQQSFTVFDIISKTSFIVILNFSFPSLKTGLYARYITEFNCLSKNREKISNRVTFTSSKSKDLQPILKFPSFLSEALYYRIRQSSPQRLPNPMNRSAPRQLGVGSKQFLPQPE